MESKEFWKRKHEGKRLRTSFNDVWKILNSIFHRIYIFMCHIRLHADQLRHSLCKHIIWILKRSWGEAGCQGKTEDNNKKKSFRFMSLNWKLHAYTWLNHQPEILAPLPQKKVWNLIPSLFNTGQSRQPNEVCRWQQIQAWLGCLNSIGLSWACFCIYSLIPNVPLKELNEMTHRVIFHPHHPFSLAASV